MLAYYLSTISTEDNKERFERLYINYKDAMYYVAYGILCDEQLAEDAVHQAFLRIIERFDRFEETSCPQTKSFCVIVCRNISIDMLRHNKKRDYIPLDNVVHQIPHGKHVEDQIISNANLESIIEKIDQLPVIYKDIILLHYSNDCSIKQIAKLLGISNETAKKRMQRAKKLLAATLLSEANDER